MKRLSLAADSMESSATHDRRICFRKEKLPMKNPRLERLNQEHRTAEIRLTREKHREKQQLAEAKELTRKARTRRLCTRGGMLESFLEEPGLLTDDDVMELLTCIFDLTLVQRKLNQLIVDRKDAIIAEIEAEAEEDP